MALRDGRAEAAAELLQRALRREPGHAGMRRNLVRALLAAGRFEQVVPQADAALDAAPDDAELHFARGSALSALGRSAAACAAFTRAVALRPEHAPSWLNHGNAAADLDDLAGAEALIRTAVRLDPGLAEAQASLGYVLTRLGRVGEALAVLDAAVARWPDFAQAQWNRAVALLLGGDFRRGFEAYEWRKRHPAFRSAFAPLPGPCWDGKPCWDGGALSGRTVLVRAEQGMGDVIHCARYLASLREAGGDPVLLCAPSLVPVLGAMPGVRAVAGGMPAYDAWVDMMSLPGLVGGAIPGSGGYLRADPARVAAWRRRLPAGRRVGVAFAGNPAQETDRRRSVPMELVRGLPQIAGLSFVNLQHGAAAAGLGLPDLTPWMTDYGETAALIEACDLVISVDTSVAHLAGALGTACWVLLAASPDWRWGLGRADTPWYDSVRLFRQERAGDWGPVLRTVFGRLV